MVSLSAFVAGLLPDEQVSACVRRPRVADGMFCEGVAVAEKEGWEDRFFFSFQVVKRCHTLGVIGEHRV